MAQVVAMELSPPEQLLCERLAAGEFAAFEGVSGQRTVRAEVIRGLLLDEIPDVSLPGGVQIIGARITGSLTLDSETVDHPLVVFESSFEEDVSFADAEMRRVMFIRSQLTGVHARGAHIRGALALNKCTVAGPVDLIGATVDGSAEFTGAQLQSTSISLDARLAKIGGELALAADPVHKQHFVAQGMIKLEAATIGGDLTAHGAELKGMPTSLEAYSADIGGGVYLEVDPATQRRCTAEGTVIFQGATIAAGLECGGADLRGTPIAMEASLAEIGFRAFFGSAENDEFPHPFTAASEVRLLAATINGDLNCTGGSLLGGLAAERVDVTGNMYLDTHGRLSPLQLHGARAARVIDAPASWPENGRLDLEGFVYGGFGESPFFSNRPSTDAALTTRERLKWLALQHDFSAQPYEQLCRMYRDAGDEQAARKVSIRREWMRIRRGTLGPIGAATHAVLGATLGFGYRPGRAVYMLLALLLAGALVVYPNTRDAIIQAKPVRSADPVTAEAECPKNYPCFSSFAYAFDVLVPVVRLGASDNWRPDSSARGNRLRSYGYAMTILGWALATLAVAGFTGLVRRT